MFVTRVLFGVWVGGMSACLMGAEYSFMERFSTSEQKIEHFELQALKGEMFADDAFFALVSWHHSIGRLGRFGLYGTGLLSEATTANEHEVSFWSLGGSAEKDWLSYGIFDVGTGLRVGSGRLGYRDEESKEFESVNVNLLEPTAYVLASMTSHFSLGVVVSYRKAFVQDKQELNDADLDKSSIGLSLRTTH